MTRRTTLAGLLPDVEGIPPGLEVGGLVQDSREVGAGDAFIALPGFGTHGLAFAERALAAGAAVVLYEPPAPRGQDVPADAIAVPGLRGRLGAMGDQFHGRPSAHMDIVGVTGTNGKTSTVQLLAQAWHRRGVRGASVGTIGAGLYGQVRATGFTTPQVLQLHALLASLRDAGARAVAMEASSHALDQGRVDGVHFDVAVFTNLTRDHLDYHGDMDSYGAAKARLFAWPGLRAAVLNLDDPFGRRLRSQLPAGLRSLGLSSRGAPGADLRAEDVRLDATGVSFVLEAGGERHPVHSSLLGRFNVDNLLAVAGALHAFGDAPADIASVLGALDPVPGRMNRLGGDGHLPLVVVDYAHTPDALEQALRSLRGHASARLLCVFGCGGERDTGKRPTMAAIAEELSDVVVVTDDNPRGEDGDAIVADILAGFSGTRDVVVERDRRKAIQRAIGEAAPNDIVLVAGKGHEAYQEVAGMRHPFDDAAVAGEALGARP